MSTHYVYQFQVTHSLMLGCFNQATLLMSKKNTGQSGAFSKIYYLTTLALPPDISFSTSFTLAMEVSPGVVIANAPWAAP